MKSLEEEVKDFCERVDQEIGEYWSNDYDELPLQIERFVMGSKWVQSEKIKAQIDILKLVHLRLSVEGIDKADYTMVFTVNELEQQLKELEDDKKI
jgi:hypothetical protein